MKSFFLAGLALLAGLPMQAADSNIASAAINELGVNLHRRLAKGEANLCCSPLSIQTALAMLYAGAAGETRTEMKTALHYPEDGTALQASLATLMEELNAARENSVKRAERSKLLGGPSEPIAFNLANRLFGQNGAAFRAPFLGVMKDRFHSPLEETNFSADPEAARKRINAWVEAQTNQRIRELVPPHALAAATRLVLANALYLKAPWENEFVESGTRPEPFRVHGKEPADAPTMQRKAYFGYASEDGIVSVALPYAGGDLQFVILLPGKPDGLRDLESRLTAARLARCATLKPVEIVLHLPKFKFESASISLRSDLEAFGMKTAFDDPKGSANFDQIAPRTPDGYLYVSDVFHQTFVAVDEHGTEAAAATAVIMAAGSAFRPAQPPEVRVDHPFLFAVQHVRSGACLFLGRVTDPREGK